MSKKPSARTKTRRKPSQDRVVLAGAPSRPTSAAKAGTNIHAVYAALVFMGKNVTESWVAGVCGQTWRIMFTGPNAISANTPFLGAAHFARSAMNTLGFECEYRTVVEPEEELKSLLTSLREHRPVLVESLLESARWGVIIGFSRRRHKLIYYDPFVENESEEIDESLFISNSPTSLLYVLSEKPKPTRKEMLLSSLAKSLDWARSGLQQVDANCPEIFYSGFTAYQHWVSWLKGAALLASESESLAHALTVAETAYARGLAPQFLKQGARSLRSENPELLQSAAAAFEEVAECFAEMQELFPVEEPSLDKASEGAQLLERAHVAERLGLGHIQRLLRSLEVSKE